MAAKAEGRDPCKNRERHVDCRHDANAAPYSPSSMPGTIWLPKVLRCTPGRGPGERALATYPEGYVAAHTVGRAASACCARCCAHRGARRARVFAANLVSDARLHSFACGSCSRAVFEPRRTRGDLLGRVPSCLGTCSATRGKGSCTLAD